MAHRLDGLIYVTTSVALVSARLCASSENVGIVDVVISINISFVLNSVATCANTSVACVISCTVCIIESSPCCPVVSQSVGANIVAAGTLALCSVGACSITHIMNEGVDSFATLGFATTCAGIDGFCASYATSGLYLIGGGLSTPSMLAGAFVSNYENSLAAVCASVLVESGNGAIACANKLTCCCVKLRMELLSVSKRSEFLLCIVLILGAYFIDRKSVV